jgi:sporulation protein YlmC with PRC-barrel domain
MSYTIKFTNGKTLAVIADQSIDDVSTGLTLVGKNVNNYGQYVNGNFVALLENFANLIEPPSPIVGQTWFDTSEGRLKVYSTGTFKPVGAPIISTIEPAGAVRGDLWVDTTNNLLKWYDGLEWQLSAKQYSDTAGKDGWFVDTITDISGFDHVVSIFYSQGVRWAVMSTSTIDLNPGTLTAIALNTNTVRPGLMVNGAIGAKFYGTATSAESIAGINLDSVLRSNSATEITAKFDFLTDDGITVGEVNNIEIRVDSTTANHVSVIAAAVIDEPLEIRYVSTSTGIPLEATAIHIDSKNDRIGVFNRTPTTDLDITGDVRINGSLIVEGSQVSIETTFLKVEDKSIELATGQTTATDAGAADGGIILHGTTDKTWTYNSSTESWQSNIDIDLASSSKSYKIAGTKVIESNGPAEFKLGGSVTSAPGLVNLPELSVLTITNAVISNITSPELSPLVISPSNNLISLNSSAKIVGMAATVDLDPDDTAITKGYFEGRIAGALGGYSARKPYILDIDITDFVNIDADVIAYLDLVLPIDGGIVPGVPDPYYAQPDGSRCSVICTRYIQQPKLEYLTIDTNTGSTTASFITNVVYTGTSATSFISTLTYVDKNVFDGNDFSVAGSVTVTPTNPEIRRFVRYYAVVAGAWTFVADNTPTYLTSTSTNSLTTGMKTFVVNRNTATVFSPTPTTTSTYGQEFSTGTAVSIRETDTQINSLEGVISSYSGTDLIVNITSVLPAASISTFSSWLIRKT